MPVKTVRSTCLLLLPAVLAATAYGAYVLWLAGRGAAPTAALTPGFAGSAACVECHAEIHALHAGTPHARALRSATDPAVLALLPNPKQTTDPETGTRHSISVHGEVPSVEAVSAQGAARLPMQWAFGSGTQGLTFVGQRPDGTWVESPQSFYRSAGWDFTVGFLGSPERLRPENATGKPLAAEDVFACFGCHTAGLQRGPNGVELKGVQPGVQCESCHGPSRAHVDAARQHRPLEGTLVPGRTSGQSMVTFCATCHRDSPPPGLKVSDPVIARFAPIGFQESACFKNSKDRFSCVSCHDPHGTSRKDPGFYRGACLKCHQTPASARCPVEPVGNCVSCHMPKQIVQRNSIFTDHWIRVPEELRRTPRSRAKRDPHREAQSPADRAGTR